MDADCASKLVTPVPWSFRGKAAKKKQILTKHKGSTRSPIEVTDSALNLTLRMDLERFGEIYSCVQPYCTTVAAGDRIPRMTRHAGGCTGRQLSASKGIWKQQLLEL
jgi:hypothetical protein